MSFFIELEWIIKCSSKREREAREQRIGIFKNRFFIRSLFMSSKKCYIEGLIFLSILNYL